MPYRHETVNSATNVASLKTEINWLIVFLGICFHSIVVSITLSSFMEWSLFVSASVLFVYVTHIYQVL